MIWTQLFLWPHLLPQPRSFTLLQPHFIALLFLKHRRHAFPSHTCPQGPLHWLFFLCLECSLCRCSHGPYSTPPSSFQSIVTFSIRPILTTSIYTTSPIIFYYTLCFYLLCLIFVPVSLQSKFHVNKKLVFVHCSIPHARTLSGT